MRAALELGRWTFPAPLGYLNAPKWSSASLVHDPERGPLVRRAFEDLATGHYTKQEVIARATEAGLRSRKGLRLSPQSFGQMMRNPIYVGRVESSDYGVSTQGDFEPLVEEATFYRAQAVLDGRIVVTGPRQRNHPDFPLRAFVRCDTCGKPLTGSWSKGRNGHYAYYHCQRQCRAVNVSKAELEGQKRDRLDEAFLFAQTVDGKSYERQRDRLREELTLAQIDHHTEAVDEPDYMASWRSQNASCRAHQTCGCRPRSITSSGCSSCSSRKELRSAEIGSIEPPQRHRFSTTWRRPRVLMKGMVSRLGIEPRTRRLRVCCSAN